jgi:hypothetical protein
MDSHRRFGQLISPIFKGSLKVGLRGTETSVTDYQSTLRRTSEERRSLKMRVSENVVLRKISGPRREKVTGDWRKLRNEECHGLHSHQTLCG